MARFLLVYPTMRKAFVYAVAVAALVLNPFFACGGPSFSYGLPEIEKALAGTWTATITREGQTHTVSFRIEASDRAEQHEEHSSRGLVRSAAACGSRTLVTSAHACIDDTFVPLKLVALDASMLAMRGTFRVLGTAFDEGQAALHIGDTELYATVSAAGFVSDVRGIAPVAVTLVHTK